jgi:hypothetical protein
MALSASTLLLLITAILPIQTVVGAPNPYVRIREACPAYQHYAASSQYVQIHYK